MGLADLTKEDDVEGDEEEARKSEADPPLAREDVKELWNELLTAAAATVEAAETAAVDDDAETELLEDVRVVVAEEAAEASFPLLPPFPITLLATEL